MNARKTIKLSQWAKENSYSYGGALKLYHRGGIPGAYQHPDTGTIRVPVAQEMHDQNTTTNRAALYARVSTRKQSEHLESQLSRLREYATSHGYTITREESEIASGMNEDRKKLTKLLDDDSWNVLIVEYKDRLARFGTTWIEKIAHNKGQEIIYVNTTTGGDEESLVEDITAVLSSFIGRLYGKRGSAQKAARIVNENFTDIDK